MAAMCRAALVKRYKGYVRELALFGVHFDVLAENELNRAWRNSRLLSFTRHMESLIREQRLVRGLAWAGYVDFLHAAYPAEKVTDTHTMGEQLSFPFLLR